MGFGLVLHAFCRTVLFLMSCQTGGLAWNSNNAFLLSLALALALSNSIFLHKKTIPASLVFIFLHSSQINYWAVCCFRLLVSISNMVNHYIFRQYFYVSLTLDTYFSNYTVLHTKKGWWNPVLLVLSKSLDHGRWMLCWWFPESLMHSSHSLLPYSEAV